MIVKDPLFDEYVINSQTVDLIVKAVAAVVMFLIGWRQLKRAPAA
jgi:hypothetical protein